MNKNLQSTVRLYTQCRTNKRLVSEERYLEERIAHVERNFSALATGLGGAVRRTARLRDKGDRIVKTLQDFASTEVGTMRKSLDGLAECLSALENCQQLKVRRCSRVVFCRLQALDSQKANVGAKSQLPSNTCM